MCARACVRVSFELKDELLEVLELAPDLLQPCVRVVQGLSQEQKQGGYFAPAPAPAARDGNAPHVGSVRLLWYGI